ncbi:MAG: hypothetical protein WCJ09_23610 [Planctomycetota bacterium]
MTIVIIRGLAEVSKNDEPVIDSAVLATLSGVQYKEERFSDYLCDDPGLDKGLVKTIKRSGTLRFEYDGKSRWLTSIVEYQTKRLLTATEISSLVNYTMQQWSDGIGENFAQFSEDEIGFAIACITDDSDLPSPYPHVEVRNV